MLQSYQVVLNLKHGRWIGLENKTDINKLVNRQKNVSDLDLIIHDPCQVEPYERFYRGSSIMSDVPGKSKQT